MIILFPTGYAGKTCERCSLGYFGQPTITGGSCTPCKCYHAGSMNNECEEKTGQCNCRPGSTGRDCSQCTEPRHVFIEDVCSCKQPPNFDDYFIFLEYQSRDSLFLIACNDNCTGILLDRLDTMSRWLMEETVHIATGYIPPPWEGLADINNNVTTLFKELKHERHLRHRVKNIPWRDYKKLKKRTGVALERVSHLIVGDKRINY